MPNKEDVLKWYQSLKSTLLTEGINLNTKGGLMSVKIGSFHENTQHPGNMDSNEGPIQYAFMKKEIDPKTGERSQYAVPAPDISKNKQDAMEERAAKNRSIHTRQSTAFFDLKKSLNEDNKTVLKKVGALKEAREKNAQELLDYEEYQNTFWEKQDQWIYQNNQLFDEEADYEDIEHLYEAAQDGLLFIQDTVYDPDEKRYDATHMRQLLVSDGNRAKVGKDLASFSEQAFEANDLYNPDKRKRLLEVNGEDYSDLPYIRQMDDERPKPLRDPGFPGIGSWLKRIFTFGRVIDENMAKYMAYKQRENDIKAFDKKAEEVRAHNEAAFEKYNKIVGEKRAKDYPEGVKDVGKLVLNAGVIAHASTEVYKGLEGVKNEAHEINFRTHQFKMLVEVKNNPQSFNPDGTRNKEESKLFFSENIENSNQRFNGEIDKLIDKALQEKGDEVEPEERFHEEAIDRFVTREEDMGVRVEKKDQGPALGF